MKRTVILLLSVLLALSLVSGCAKEEETEVYEDYTLVGFSQVGAESDWRNTNTRSMQSALSHRNGFRLIFDDSQQKKERQITAIRNFIQQGVDYIVLAPGTESGWDTVLLEAKEAGIPVIIVDRMIEVSDESLFKCWVGSDFLNEGRTAVAWLAEHYGDRPLRIVHLQGNIGSSAQLGRTQGLDEGLAAHPEWELVYRGSGDFTDAKGQELIEALLRDGIGFDVIYSENDNMTYGALRALKNAGIDPKEDVVILAIDANRAALELVLEGEIDFDVECNPLHGPRVQAIIEELQRGETPPKFTYVKETAFDRYTLSPDVLEWREY